MRISIRTLRMTQPSDIHDDLHRILALAKRALTARDDAAAWARLPEKQIGHHGACCDALWDELERLVQVHDGITPAIEHPTRGNGELPRKFAGALSLKSWKSPASDSRLR